MQIAYQMLHNQNIMQYNVDIHKFKNSIKHGGPIFHFTPQPFCVLISTEASARFIYKQYIVFLVNQEYRY